MLLGALQINLYLRQTDYTTQAGDDMRKTVLFCGSFTVLIYFCASLYAEPPGPPAPLCGGDCFFIASVNTDYRNVSESYARSIFARIQDILYAYLGEGKMDRYYFFGDMKTQYENEKHIDLICRLVRVEDEVSLSVTMKDLRTQEVYLGSEYAASFFAPNDLLRAFADSFPQKFGAQVPNRYVYRPYNEGYVTRWGTILLDDVRYPSGTLLNDFQDFLFDLNRTNGLPRGTISRFERFRTRKSIEVIALYSSSLMLLCEGVYFASGGPTGQVYQAGAATAMSLGLLSSVMVVVDWPRALMKELNDWNDGADAEAVRHRGRRSFCRGAACSLK
jgi:hypothetical protein